MCLVNQVVAARTAEPVPSADGQTPAASTASTGHGSNRLRMVLTEISIVFILTSSYFAMVLTNWATLQSSFAISNPRTGTTSMWLQASAQWIALLMYAWALVAPKLFPDRDFS